MRNKATEFQTPNGIAPVGKITHIDWYAGPWDDLQDAFAKVPAEIRDIGRPFDIYRPPTKTSVIHYYWGKNKLNQWIAVTDSTETGTFIDSIGDVTVTEDVVTVTTGIDGKTRVYFDWIPYEIDEWVDLPYTPVSSGKIKVLIVYAMPDSTLLYLAEGTEGTETTEPNLPVGALFIRRGIATSEGVDFDPGVELVGYKQKIEDNWLRTVYTIGTNIILQFLEDKLNFYMWKSLPGSGTTKIRGILFPEESTRDYEFKIYNGSAGDMTIESSTTSGLTKGISTSNTPYILKSKQTVFLKYNSTTDLLDILNLGGNAESRNITNSSNTTTGSYTQTQRNGDMAVWDTAGNPYMVKNLPDKSDDAAFIDFMGKNPATGQLGKVGYYALDNLFGSFTPTQALALAQRLNANVGSAGLMGVNVISPPLFERENNNLYIVLRGSNLYLNTAAMAVEIVNTVSGEVVATVPNSQVQLYADGLSLVFYYNFYTLGIGLYKVKLTSGVKTLVTTLTFQIVSAVENINISGITWDKLVNNTIITNDQNIASGGNVTILDNQNTVDTNVPVISFLSSELFAQGDNWYIELQISTGIKRPNQKYTLMRFGVCYSNSTNQFAFLPIHFWEYGKVDHILTTKVNTNTDVIQTSNEGAIGASRVISITKLGNNLTITDGKQVGVMTISNNSGYSLSAQSVATIGNYGSTNGTEAMTMTILKAFKIL